MKPSNRMTPLVQAASAFGGQLAIWMASSTFENRNRVYAQAMHFGAMEKATAAVLGKKPNGKEINSAFAQPHRMGVRPATRVAAARAALVALRRPGSGLKHAYAEWVRVTSADDDSDAAPMLILIDPPRPRPATGFQR
jgi:hypothetical protein